MSGRNDGLSGAGSPRLVAWVIWFALFSAIGIYFAVIQFTVQEDSESAESSLRNIFYLAGVGALIASVVARVIMIRRLPEGSSIERDTAVLRAVIVCCALAESPAVFGLVLGIGGEPLKAYLPLFAMSVVGFFLSSPNRFFPSAE